MYPRASFSPGWNEAIVAPGTELLYEPSVMRPGEEALCHFGVGSASLFADRLQHAVLVPLAVRPWAFLAGRSRGLTDRLRDECSHALADVLADLHPKHLGLRHLPVEELNDPAKLSRDLVCDEHQAQFPGLEVRFDRRPE